jgi:hypothetical protein
LALTKGAPPENGSDNSSRDQWRWIGATLLGLLFDIISLNAETIPP